MTLFIVFISTILAFLLYRFILKKKQKRAQFSICDICGKEFLDKELMLEDDLSVCSQDYIELKQNTWVEARTFLSDPNNPEASMEVYRLHKELNFPTYIKTEYFEENGTLFSSFKLFVRSQDLDNL